MELLEFVSARIAEDQAWVRAQEKVAVRTHRFVVNAPHPGHWNRVKRECRAKRRVLEIVSRMRNRDTARTLLIALAGVWADHPDFEPDWAST